MQERNHNSILCGDLSDHIVWYQYSIFFICIGVLCMQIIKTCNWVWRKENERKILFFSLSSQYTSWLKQTLETSHLLLGICFFIFACWAWSHNYALIKLFLCLYFQGAFELGCAVCPIAIKYNKIFVDAFWNSKKYGIQTNICIYFVHTYIPSFFHILPRLKCLPGNLLQCIWFVLWHRGLLFVMFGSWNLSISGKGRQR